MELEDKKNSIETISVEDNLRKKKVKYRVFSILGIIIIASVITIIKIYNPSFPWKYIFIIGGGVLFLGAIVFFWFNIGNYIKKATSEKSSASLEKLSSREEIDLALKKFIFNRFNHIKSIDTVIPFSAGSILCYKLNLLYNDGDNGKNIWVIMDVSNLEKEFGIVKGDIDEIKLKEIANGISSKPSIENIRESEEYDPISGRTHKYKEVTPFKKDEHKKESEEIV